MKTFAKFKSVDTPNGIQIFRYETVFEADKGGGDIIGLVYMMNPGGARPSSEFLFNKLCTSQYCTPLHVDTEPDKTMQKAIGFIESAFEHNKIKLPKTFTIHVENLFNIREKNSEEAKKLARAGCPSTDDIMYKHRVLEPKYSFVWLAWGQDDMGQPVADLLTTYPNSIIVKCMNVKGKKIEVNYPVHPLYMNKQYFLEAAQGKIVK